MSEMIDEPDFGPDEDVAAAIARGEVIGGALDPRTKRIVPVGRPVEVFRNDEEGYTLYEFRIVRDGVETNEAVVLMADVDVGGRTRCWRLTDAARAEGYAETEIIYSGQGALHHWSASDEHSPYAIRGEDGAQQQVAVGPGEAFMIVADGARDEARQVGVRVISLCTTAFQDRFESAIAPPTSVDMPNT